MQEALLYFLLIFTPLAYGTVEVWSVTIMHVVSISILTIWAVSLLRSGQVKLYRTQIDILILLFFVLFFISSLLSEYPYASRILLYKYINYALIFYFLINTFRNRQKLTRLIWVIAIFGGIYAFAGLTLIGTDLSGIKIFSPERHNISFTFVNHNHFAGYLEMITLVCLGTALGYKGWKRSLLISLGGVASVAILFSLSRGGTISLFGGLLFLFIVSLFHKDNKKDTLLLAGFCVIVLIISLSFDIRPVLERLQTLGDPVSAGSGRIEVWKGVLNMTADNPWFGSGPGTFQYAFAPYKNEQMIRMFYTHAHNDYLELLAEIGFIGAFTALLCIVVLFATVIKKIISISDRKLKYIGLGALSGCFAILLHSNTDFNFSIPSNALLFTVCAAIAVISASYDEPVWMNMRITGKTKIIGYIIILTILPLILSVVISPYLGDYYHKTALAHQESKRYDDAEASLVKAMFIDPGNAEYSATAGDLLTIWSSNTNEREKKESLLTKSLYYYDNAIKENPLRGYYYTKKAFSLQKLGRFEEAEEPLKTAAILEPMSPLAFYNTGNLYLSQGKIDKAIKEYNKFFQLNINIRYLTRVLDELWLLNQDYDEIKKIIPENNDYRRRFAYYLLGKKNVHAAFEEFKYSFSLKQSAVNAGAHINGLNSAGEYYRALNAAKTYMVLFPDSPPLLRQVAVSYERTGMSKEAEALYRKLIIINPDDLSAVSLLARIYIRMKAPSDAAKVLNQALNNNPENVRLKRQLASAYEKMGRHNDTRAILMELMTGDRDDIPLYNNLNRLFLKEKDYSGSVNMLNKALGHFPTSSLLKKRLASTYVAMGRSGEAIPIYRGLISEMPQDVPSHISLAKIYMKDNNLNAALNIIDTAVIFNAADARLYVTLANIYRRQKRYNDALDALKKSVLLKPQNPDYHYQLGIDYKRLGLLSDAYEEWKKCLQIRPGHSRCKTSLEKNIIYQ